jgi:hypothetical protein
MTPQIGLGYQHSCNGAKIWIYKLLCEIPLVAALVVFVSYFIGGKDILSPLGPPSHDWRERWRFGPCTAALALFFSSAVMASRFADVLSGR